MNVSYNLLDIFIYVYCWLLTEIWIIQLFLVDEDWRVTVRLYINLISIPS